MLNELPKFTVGILTRGSEVLVLKKTLETWNEGGFLEIIPELIIMVNQKTPSMESFLNEFKKENKNVKILESIENHGISKALNWLMGNATNEYFLFMEKDFRLVEPFSCVIEQFNVGFKLLDNNNADIVKYRSRFNAGKPNYAEIIYKSREDDVFRIQPNLLCNFYHWIDNPAERWPNHFEICNTNPLFYCVKSKFCNWTNNPILLKIDFWFSNFYNIFNEIREGDANFNLEGFMNGNGNAWNNREYIIAEGEGLFKHCDINNMG